MWDCWALILPAYLLHLCAKPCIIGFWVSHKARRQRTIFDYARKQYTYGVRNRQTQVGQLFAAAVFSLSSTRTCSIDV